MKIKTLLLLGFLAFAVLPASAEITVNDYTSREYLKNYGYSDMAIEIVEITKGSVNGEKVVLPYDVKYQKKSWLGKKMSRALDYIDPARDNHTFMREDLKFEPNVNDL